MAGPPMPEGQVLLAGPPVLPEAATPGFGSGRSRTRKIRAERREYLHYLAQLRQQRDEAAAAQRTALYWDNPDPRDLWSVAAGPRLWERRATDDDFATVRFGLGVGQAALKFVPPRGRPVEDLEPLCAVSLRRFMQTYQTVPSVPVTVNLRNFTSVEFAGEDGPVLGLVRAMIGQLAVFHSPDELRIAVVSDQAGLAEWDWVKWLPHNAHPHGEDAAGPLRLVASGHEALMDLLGPEFTERPGHDTNSVPETAEPLFVVVAHRCVIPGSSRLLGAGVRNAVLFDVTGDMPGGPDVFRLTAEATASVEIDELSQGAADRLARVIAPMRTDSRPATLLATLSATSPDIRNPIPLGVVDLPHEQVLPSSLPADQLPPPNGDVRMCLGWEEQQLRPIWHDFARAPHLLVFGDGKTGKTNVLRLVAQAITRRYRPSEAMILLGDPRGELRTSVPEEYRAGYAIDTEGLAELNRRATVSMTARLPGADITPERMEKRDWWSGPQLFVLIDDYDLIAPGGIMNGPMVPLVRVLGQSPHIGLRLVIARSSSGAMRAMTDPLLRRLWELGSPAVLLSCPDEEGEFLGAAKPRTLPPGRAQLVTWHDITLIQTGLVSQEGVR
jgi:hypothetical protein